MDTEARPHPGKRYTAFACVMAGLVLVFLALGTWQVQRLFWKLDLIARVDARIHADAVPAPLPAQWPLINQAADEYRRVTIHGTFLHDKQALVQAVTERGAGFWVLTPLVTTDRGTVLINRGFVPMERRDAAARQAGEIAGDVAVTGLLRLPEPGGGFLRTNDPAADRWYSRDVAAIAASRGLGEVAPYFIDADATENPGGLPVGGLTVVSFRNSHLVYALTWYALAAMSIAAVVYLMRQRGKQT
ncbi:surfeit locus 1 family protein [Neorhizobium galegae]|uniref:SURF1 family protein n=1 Tax=Neorhizobium galegae TaxID=399 RepID=UPI001AE91243|nr:surfeit locus 1 family protein [Neorhizobium galegae]